jgi:hypothetical protein
MRNNAQPALAEKRPFLGVAAFIIIIIPNAMEHPTFTVSVKKKKDIILSLFSQWDW